MRQSDKLRINEGVTIDPKSRNCPDVIRYAARKGFRVIHYPDFRGQFRFRHRTGRTDFFVFDLKDVRPCDLDVFD